MTDNSGNADNIIAFQGELGAYSHMACQEKFPDMEVMPCPSFEDALAAVQKGRARLAMIPIENSTAGRVADIHMLLPGSGLFIIKEHFLPIRHCLLGLKDSKDEDIKTVTSHVQALGQCRLGLREMGLKPVAFADTAGAAHHVSDLGDKSLAAIAGELAAEVYGLRIIKADIHDHDHNTTRFVVLSRQAADISAEDGKVMTTFTFEVKNIPAALYKALGGFATNSVNMTKLESYYDSDSFTATEFFADIEGDLTMPNVARAMEELEFHSKRVNVLGTYPQARSRAIK